MGGSQASGYLSNSGVALQTGKEWRRLATCGVCWSSLRARRQAWGRSRAWTRRPGGIGWAGGRGRSDLEGISEIIYPTYLFDTKSLRPKEEKGLAQGHSMG